MSVFHSKVIDSTKVDMVSIMTNADPAIIAGLDKGKMTL